jgi:CHAD domain-containing protein
MRIKKDIELKKGEDFRVGILRILDALHTNSEKLISVKSRQHVSIHELRKNIKKIRGIIKLIRHEIGHEKYHELNTYYRNIANEIAILRDDTSQIELLKSMQKNVANPDIHKAFRKAIRQIERKRKNEFIEFYQQSKDENIKNLLKKQANNYQDLEFTGDAELFILKSLKRVHKRARSAFEVSGFLKNEDLYHYLRKQSKYLMYHLTILNLARPSYLNTYLSELEKLNNLLGKLHDLGLFNNHILEKRHINLNNKQKALMLRLVYSRRASLKKKIEFTGERLFNESSEEFVIRVYEIWTNSFKK